MHYIQYFVKDQIAYITLNRPEKRNALSYDLVTELKGAFTAAEEDSAVKIIVLKANGETFCAGADLAYLQQLQNFTYEENLQDSTHLKDLFYKIYALKKVVIAQVQGHALAGGCGLATVCDFCFSVPHAKFGYPEVKIGFIPAIVMVFLMRKIGEARAKKMLLSGDLFAAEEAHYLGMVTKISYAEELDYDVQTFARKLIAQNSTYAMGLTKTLMAESQSLTLGDALTFAAEMNAKARASEDCKRGIHAFLNKQNITW